jgi:hypothetical protein
MKNLGFEIRPVSDDDLTKNPEWVQNEKDGYATLLQYAVWAMLFPNGVKAKPIYFMRNMNPDSWRWMGIINPGNSVIDPQTEAHVHDLAQGNAVCTPYHLESKNPDTYVISSEEPYAWYSFSKDGGRWIEGRDGCVFDLKFKPMAYSEYEHADSPRGSIAQLTPVIVEGTYEGKPVRGMGGYDRTYIPRGMTIEEANFKSFAYISVYFNSIRSDGRHEHCYGLLPTINGKNGYGEGVYYIDGEEPIVTNEVVLENGVFRRLPYLKEGDHTVALTGGVWKFGGREFHMDCKWGGKGFTSYPKIERVGQSQTYGTWYEGSEPYEQELFGYFSESMNCYEETVKTMGFEVID